MSPSMMKGGSKPLMDYLSRSLTAFQSSHDVLRVLCTVPHNGDGAAPRRPERPVKKLIVLDSSFNPPTTAHAQMAKSAIRATGLADTRLMLLLAVNNADKAPKPASLPLRLGMMEAFAQDLLAELQQDGSDMRTSEDERLQIDLAVTTMPYFHDKSRAIADSGFYSQDTQQVFLAGFDTLIRIFKSKYYGQGSPSDMRAALGPLFAAARLRITMRPDDEWGTQEEQKKYVKDLEEGGLGELGGEMDWLQRLDLVEGVQGVVSSSKARDMVKAGETENLRRLVGERVRRWIEAEGLYQDDQ